MRQLLLVEAAALPKPNTQPLSWPRRARKRRLVSFSADAPESWRVSFRCFSAPRRAAGAKRRSRTPKPRVTREDRWSFENTKKQSFHGAWPLAERAEASLRVFNDPLPYAKRLARRLYAKPQRARAVQLFTPGAPGIVGEENFAITFGPALKAMCVFDTS